MSFEIIDFHTHPSLFLLNKERRNIYARRAYEKFDTHKNRLGISSEAVFVNIYLLSSIITPFPLPKTLPSSS